MTWILDLPLLRRSEHKDVVTYLRQQLTTHGSELISNEIFAAVEGSLVSPHVLGNWLSVCHDPDLTARSLKQSFSIIGRTAAIERFCKALRSEASRAFWDAVGDSTGLARLFSTISVEHVKIFCIQLGRLGSSQGYIAASRARTTDLFNILTGQSSSQPNPDVRPLECFYVHILPACEEACVREWIKEDRASEPDNKRLLNAHPALFQEIVRDVVKKEAPIRFKFDHTLLFKTIPATASLTPGLSSTMAFSAEIFRLADKHQSPSFRHQCVEDGSVASLLRRLVSRHSHRVVKDTQDIVKIVGAWGPPENAYQTVGYGPSVLPPMVKLWSYWPDGLQDTFEAMLQHCQLASQYLFPGLLRSVPHHQRLPLLRLLCHHALKEHVDIGDQDKLRETKLMWDVEVFQALKHDDAVELLDRLVQAHQETCFLSTSEGYLTTISNLIDGDPTLLRLILNAAIAERPDQARSAIAAIKERAVRSSEQSQRARLASKALKYAVAVADLDLFQETLLWAGRFNKDPLTLKELYSCNVFSTHTTKLLAAMRHKVDGRLQDVESLSAAITKGNAIILGLLETACAAISEPSFSASTWHEVLRLVGSVVTTRIADAPVLQKALGLSDEVMYSSIWSGTLDTCISAERTISEQDNAPLCRGDWSVEYQPHSLLYGYAPTVKPESSIPSTRQFLDRLAGLRDRDWIQRRRRLNSDVTQLREPWPRGLAIQSFVPFELHQDFVYAGMQYHIQRARQIVFIDRETAMQIVPDNDAHQKARGTFIDLYEVALRIWIHQDDDISAQKSRTLEAWNHTQSELSSSFASSSDAAACWAALFKQWSVDLPKSLTASIRRLELVPLPLEDADGLTEWNPQPGLASAADETQTQSSITAIDVMADQHAQDSVIGASYKPQKVLTVKTHHIFAWRRNVRSMLVQDKETLTVLALLYTEAKYHLGQSVLARPFPDSEDPRFPMVFLDQDFLDSSRYHVSYSQTVLQDLAADVPVPLLLKLFHRLEQKSQTEGKGSEQLFEVLKILLQGDRPHTGLDLVQQLILNYPGDSSWHRIVVHRGLCLRLSSEETRQFLLGVARAVQDRMDKRNQTLETDTNSEDSDNDDWKDDESEEQPTNSRSPYVKITTIRMLIQLTINATFLGAADIMNIIISMLDSTTHVDVRQAAIEGLGELLLDTKDAAIEDGIMRALERLIQSAGGFLDYSPLNDTDWTAAEESGILPAVDHQYSTILPTMSSLISLAKRLKQAKRQSSWRALFERVLLPVLQHSTENQRRWSRLYLQQQGRKQLDAHRLPEVPAYPSHLVALIVDFTPLMSKQHLASLDQYIETALHPPQEIVDFNNDIQKANLLERDNAAEYWLYLWQDSETSQITKSAFRDTLLTRACKVLCEKIDPKVDDGITVNDVQELWWKYTKYFIDTGSSCADRYQRQMRLIDSTDRNKEERQKFWLSQCRPLLVRTVAYIASLRTPQWQKDANRTPDRLPDEADLHLQLLSYPIHWSEQGQEKKADTFAEEIISKLREIAIPGRLYHNSLEKLRQVSKRTGSIECTHMVAIRLGSIERLDHDQPQMVDSLRIDLAEGLLFGSLDEARLNEPDTKLRIRSMVDRWAQSPVEDFRTSAERLRNRHTWLRRV